MDAFPGDLTQDALERHTAFVRALAISLVGRDDAEDLAQDVDPLQAGIPLAEATGRLATQILVEEQQNRSPFVPPRHGGLPARSLAGKSEGSSVQGEGDGGEQDHPEDEGRPRALPCGPPPRPLDEYETKVEEGVVFIHFVEA